MKLAMFGLGTVGSSVVKLIRERSCELAMIAGERVDISTVVVRDDSRARSINLEGITVTSDPRAVLDDPECRIVIEVVGGTGPAAVFVTEALRRNRTVITANKELVATMRGDLVRAAAGGGRLFCEASVGAAIPLVRSQCTGADRVLKIEAVLNGTTNYILDLMEQGLSYEEALADAQLQGYAEQDPTSDIEGHDAARKLAILAGLTMASNVYPEDVVRAGIRGVRPVDVCRHGKRLRLVAGAVSGVGGVCLYVLPRLVDQQHPLARVHGTHNGVLISGEASGEISLFGPGAGGMPTAYAVVSDLVSALRGEAGVVDVLRRISLLPRTKPLPLAGEVELRPLSATGWDVLRREVRALLADPIEEHNGRVRGVAADIGEVVRRCEGKALVLATPAVAETEGIDVAEQKILAGRRGHTTRGRGDNTWRSVN